MQVQEISFQHNSSLFTATFFCMVQFVNTTVHYQSEKFWGGRGSALLVIYDFVLISYAGMYVTGWVWLPC